MATTDATETAPPLVQGLGLLDATMIVAGSMIGSGIFITPAESARLVGSPGWLLVAWALTGVLTLTGALCCGELAAMMPRAGGQYVFLREAYGPPVGFLFGWSFFFVVQTGAIAAVSVAFAKFLGVFAGWVSAETVLVAPVPLGGTGYALSLTAQQLVAVVIVVGLSAANTLGLRVGRLIQNTFTFAKLAALAGLIAVGLTVGRSPDAAAWTSPWWRPEGASPAAPGAVGWLALAMVLGRAMIGPLFSQTSWNNVTFTGGETRDPGRVLPRALLLGCGSVVGLYMLANVAYVVSLPLAAIEHAPEDRVGTAMMARALGPPGVYAMAAAVLVSTFGCVNGATLSGARVYYAMARDGLFFRQAGTVNARHVPAVALLAQGAWASLLTLARTVTVDPKTGSRVYGNVYNQLLEYIVCADLSFYILMVAAVIVMRWKSPAAERPFRTPLYPLPPLLYLTLATLLVLDLVYLAPWTSGMGFAIALTGLPVYYLRCGVLGRGSAESLRDGQSSPRRGARE
jgi:APA family basic amino acid/polyamine antiporter